MQNMSSFIHEGWQWTRTAIWIIVEEFTNILNYKQKPSLMTNYRCLMLPANSKDCHNPAHSLITKKREKEGEKHEREVDSKESCWFPSSSWGWVIWAPISRDLSTLRENANRVEQRLSCSSDSTHPCQGEMVVCRWKNESKERTAKAWRGLRLLFSSDNHQKISPSS